MKKVKLLQCVDWIYFFVLVSLFVPTIYTAPPYSQCLINALHAHMKNEHTLKNIQFYGKDDSFFPLHQFTSHITSLNKFFLVIKYLLIVENVNIKK